MKTSRPLRLICRFLPLVLAGAALLIFESDLLWKIQSLNLFLYSRLFFEQQMVVPGGMLVYVATYFTQHLFYPWLGVLLLCGWWGLLMWLTHRAFRLPSHWWAVLFIPVALLLVANVDLGYWLYLLKLRGNFFAATIGTTFMVALLWAFRSLPAFRGWAVFRPALIVLTVLIGYPLAGAYALMGALLMGVWAWRIETTLVARICDSITALLSIALIPLCCYYFVYHETNLDNIYWAALPVFTFIHDYPAYYIPYILLLLFFLTLTILPTARPEAPAPHRRQQLLQGGLVVLLGVGVWLAWFKDENFHHELHMQHCIERLDWGGVLREAEHQDCAPTRSIVMMRNLALSRIGRQGELMCNFPNGSARPEAPFDIFLLNIIGRMIYYQYGLMNECHRLCMEDGVEYGWRAEHLQYMARSALLAGEPQVTRKYLRLLSQTRYYRRWAEHFGQLVDYPDLIAKTPETARVSQMLHYENSLGADNGYVEKYIMTLLAQHDSDEPYFQEQTLLATLWTKNSQQFWPSFTHYVRLHPQGEIPRLYQEAAYLFARQEHRTGLENVPFRDDVRQNYHAFMEQYGQCRGMSLTEIRQKLYPYFGHTYYYEYFLMKDLNYY